MEVEGLELVDDPLAVGVEDKAVQDLAANNKDSYLGGQGVLVYGMIDLRINFYNDPRWEDESSRVCPISDGGGRLW